MSVSAYVFEYEIKILNSVEVAERPLYVCSYYFSSVSVAEWPPFGK